MIEITLTSLLVVILGLLPGAPAEWVYSKIVGISRHETEVIRGLRTLGFSILGLILYAVVARIAGWPPASHVVPATFGKSFQAEMIPALGLAYLGHGVGSVLAGSGSAVGHVKLRRGISRIHVRDAWDHLITECVASHWVVVRTTSGESYVGMMENVDVAVEPQYRDIILEEPARYEEETDNYRTTRHQYLFIPGEEVASVAVVYDQNTDERVTQPGEILFDQPIGGDRNARQGLEQ